MANDVMKIGIEFQDTGLDKVVSRVKDLENAFNRSEKGIKANQQQVAELRSLINELSKSSEQLTTLLFGKGVDATATLNSLQSADGILNTLVSGAEAFRTVLGDAKMPARLASEFAGLNQQVNDASNTVQKLASIDVASGLQAISNTKLKTTSFKKSDNLEQEMLRVGKEVAGMEKANQTLFDKPIVSDDNINKVVAYTDSLRTLNSMMRAYAGKSMGKIGADGKRIEAQQYGAQWNYMSDTANVSKEVADLYENYPYNVLNNFKTSVKRNNPASTMQAEIEKSQGNGYKVPVVPATTADELTSKVNALIEATNNSIKEIQIKLTVGTSWLNRRVQGAVNEIQSQLKQDPTLKDNQTVNNIQNSLDKVNTTYQNALPSVKIDAGKLGLSDVEQKAESLISNLRDKFKETLKINLKLDSKDVLESAGFIKLQDSIKNLSLKAELKFSDKDLENVTNLIQQVDTLREKYGSIGDAAKSADGRTPFNFQKDAATARALNAALDLLVPNLNALADALERLKGDKSAIPEEGIKITELSSALQNAVTGLETMNTETKQIDSTPFNELLGVMQQIADIVAKGFGFATLAEQASQFEKVSTMFASLPTNKDGSLKLVNGGKEQIAAVASEYQKYLSMGGTKGVADLTDNAKSAERFSAALSTIQSQKAVEAQKIDTSNLDGVKSSIEGLGTATQSAEGTIGFINSLSEAIKNVQTESFSSKITDVQNALSDFIGFLNSKDVSNSTFLSTLNDMLSKTEELSSLASILKESSNKIQQVAKATGTSARGRGGKSSEEESIIATPSIMNKAFDDMIFSAKEGGVNYERFLDRTVNRLGETQENVLVDREGKDGAGWVIYNKAYSQYKNTLQDLTKFKGAVNAKQLKESEGIESVQEAEKAVKAYNEALIELQKNKSVDNINNVLSTMMTAKGAVDDVVNKSTNYIKKTQFSGLITAASKDINQNGKMPVDLMAEYERFVASMNVIKNSGASVTRETHDNMAAWLSDLQSRLQQTGNVGKSVFQRLGTSIGSRVAQFTAFYLSFYRVVGYIKQGIQSLEKFDTTLTKISYTMNVSEGTLEKMGNTMQSLASDLSAPLEKVEQIYTVYANMKTDPKEIEELTKYTTVLSNLSGIDASAAADDVQGVINQFALTTDDVAHVVDTFDYISANIAVDYSKGIEGLAEAVQGSGNVARVAGLSFEQYAAIIAKTMEQTRLAGSTIGNGMRTIMTRLSKANKLDDTVDNSSLSDAAKTLHNRAGIDVYTRTGEYREFDVIMTELANKWDDLTDAEQADISFAIAATRQTATLKAILDNWTDSMNLATEAVNNQGSALKNNEKYEKSYAGRIQKVKTNIENFAVDFFDDSALNATLDGIGKLTNSLEGLGEIMGSIPSLAGVIATFSAFRKNGAMNPLLGYNPAARAGSQWSFGGMTRAGYKDLYQGYIDGGKSRGAAVGGVIKNTIFPSTMLNPAQMKEVENFYNVYKQSGQNISVAEKELTKFSETQKGQLKTMVSYAGSAEELQGTFKSLSLGARIGSKAVNILGSALTGLITGFVMLGLQAIITYFVDISKESETAKNNIKQLNDEFSSSRKERASNLQTITSLDKDYALLSRGVDDLGNNVSLTTDEFEKYNNIAGQVADIMPSLIKGWTDEGNAIIDVASKYGSLTEAYKDYQEKAQCVRRSTLRHYHNQRRKTI